MDNQQPSVEMEWRTTKECERYEVNQFGQIRHKKRKQILKPRPNHGGYEYVNFNINGKRTNFAVHRIVAHAFIPNPKGLKEVNHKDYNKSNNKVDNLEWVTSSKNKQHAYKKIENHITRGKQVEQYTLTGEYVQTYNTVSEAAKSLKCCISAISNCCLGRTKTSMGFQWKFSEGSTTKYERIPSSSVQDSEKSDEDIV